MSQIKVNGVVDASGGNTATINTYTPTESNMMGKNRIINGDMRIDQRNAGAAVTSSGSYVVDRFPVVNSTDGAFSAQQDSSAPAGFVNSIKYTTTTADGTLTTTQNSTIRQSIEGTNVADLGWGTANAKTVTLSFWVRSSLTGTFGGAVSNSGQTRSYPFTYSISAANTWEQKSVTIAGDTSGTWLTTTGIGLTVFFALGCGPDRSGTAGAWAGAQYVSATGAVSVIGTLNATFYITGVQLEVGSTATPFERRPYGTELMLCQRYCYSIFANQANDSYARYGIGDCRATTVLESFNYLPVVMRARPSVTTTGTASNYGVYSAGSITACSAVPAILDATTYGIAFLSNTVASGLTAGRAGQLLSNNNTTSYLIFAAEL